MTIDIDEYREHTVSEVICIGCGHRWMSVRPSSVLLKEIVCPTCGAGKVIETGQRFE